MREVEIAWDGEPYARLDAGPRRPAVGDVVLPLIQSTVVPGAFRHGFTTRRGGVSLPPFDSLNLGARWGDNREHVAENQRRLQVAAGGGRIHFATQVHGADSVVARLGAHPDLVAAARADAVIAPEAGVAVGVYTADCVPVLLADARSGVCAAIHAGWRGTVAGVVTATIRTLVKDHGCHTGDLRVAIGPSIGPCCFEVGPEVVTAVESAFPSAGAAGAIIPAGKRPRPHVDLWLLNRVAAQDAGIAADAIDVARACTACEGARFFSYRRDRGQTGQLAAFIVRDQEPVKTTP